MADVIVNEIYDVEDVSKYVGVWRLVFCGCEANE